MCNCSTWAHSTGFSYKNTYDLHTVHNTHWHILSVMHKYKYKSTWNITASQSLLELFYSIVKWTSLLIVVVVVLLFFCLAVAGSIALTHSEQSAKRKIHCVSNGQTTSFPLRRFPLLFLPIHCFVRQKYCFFFLFCLFVLTFEYLFVNIFSAKYIHNFEMNSIVFNLIIK